MKNLTALKLWLEGKTIGEKLLSGCFVEYTSPIESDYAPAFYERETYYVKKPAGAVIEYLYVNTTTKETRWSATGYPGPQWMMAFPYRKDDPWTRVTQTEETWEEIPKCTG